MQELFTKFTSRSRERERESKKSPRFVKSLFSFFLFTIFFFTIHSSVRAATYYVATTGSDSNTTTQAQSSGTPWLTLQHAENTATNGDTVHIAAGTYNENDSFFHSWASAKAISWIADGSVTVRAFSSTGQVAYISGSGAASYSGITFDGNSTTSTAVPMDNSADNKTFINCTFENATTNLVTIGQPASSITFTSPTFSGSPSNAGISLNFNNASNLVITNLTVSNFTSQYFLKIGTASSNVTINGGTITASLSHEFLNTASTGNVSIQNITAIISANGGTNPGAFYYPQGSNTGSITISNNNITYSNPSTAQILNIQFGTHAVTVSNNSITAKDPNQDFSAIFIRNQPNPSVTGNTVDGNGITISDLGLSLILVDSSGTVVGSATISNNTVYSTQPAGALIRIGADSSSAGDNKLDGTIINGNKTYGLYYYNPSGSGGNIHNLEFGFNKNGVIYDNYANGGDYGLVLKGANTYTSGGVYNNIYVNNRTGVWIAGMASVPVYNNTVYNSLSFTGGANVRLIAQGTAYSTGTILKNNTFYQQPNHYQIQSDTNSSAGLVSDYNLFFTAGSSAIKNTLDSTQVVIYTSLAAWKAAGYDSNSIYGDPSFINPNIDNYRVLRGSPAIDAGIDLSSLLTTDYAGTSRPQGSSFDIGAYEYIPLTVTINQKTGQADPTTGSTINYTVIFSESVSDFATGDVTLSGTAGATTATVTGSGTTYNIAVSGMTGSGTVIATIAADVATGATSNTNAISTSTDNTVTYDVTSPVGGSITYSDGKQDSTTVTLAVSDGTDSESGVDTATRTILRKSATLSGDSCGNYSSFAATTVSGTYPNFTDSGVARGNCYQYEYQVTDNAGNLATYTSTSATKILFSTPSTPVCSDTTPIGTTPWLYEANSNNGNSITLRFTNWQSPVDHFALEYGTSSNNYQFGSNNIGGNGTNSYTVNSLNPNTTYYFRVRAGNGCATGNWSNELSAKTLGSVSTNNFNYLTGSNNSNNLNIVSSELKPVGNQTTKQVATDGYSVKVKVVDTDQKPVSGAKVTIHSKVQEATTNKEGIVEFKNVESGDHKVLIAYNNYQGEQSINLTGDVKEFDLNITVKPQPFSLSPLAIGIIGGMGMLVVVLVVYIIKTKKRVKPSDIINRG